MGCLDSVPEDSPEGRARENENALGLSSLKCKDFRDAFFGLNDYEIFT